MSLCFCFRKLIVLCIVVRGVCLCANFCMCSNAFVCIMYFKSVVCLVFMCRTRVSVRVFTFNYRARCIFVLCICVSRSFVLHA